VPALPDPRDRHGLRHDVAGKLAVAVCAVLAAAKSLAAIGEWAPMPRRSCCWPWGFVRIR
jgi:hypothetical protein